MKKNILNIVGLTMTLVFALVLAGCGANPKGLAKQTYDLYQQSIAAMDNPLKLPGVMVKAASLGKKVNRLSERDRQIYNEELARLGGAEGLDGLFGIEGLDGLFGAEGLSSLFGAEGLGGLFGAEGLGGLFGDGGGSAQSGDSDGESGGATAPSSRASNATAPSSGGKTTAFFNMFDSGTYHMKAKTAFGGMEVISETFMKDGMMATVGETAGMSYRTVYRDNMAYVINDQTRTVMVMSLSASSGNKPEEPVRTAGMVATSSGTAQFNGKNLPYEEYSVAGESSVKIQLFLDGNNLAGMRTITSGATIDMIILALDQNVPNNMFDIPAGYQRIEM